MNIKKFTFVSTLILSIFLFLTGTALMLYINTSSDYAEPRKIPRNILDEILLPYKNSTEPLNFLVLGGDSVGGNTDTMMLVNFNPQYGTLNIMSIPRDTKARVNGIYEKINAAYPRGGIDLALKTVNDLLNVDIQHYVVVDLSTFVEVIDILGGVDFYVPENMRYDDPLQNLHINLTKGHQRLDGAKAEQFMRFRHHNNHAVTAYYDGSDLRRIQAQQNFLKELVKQKANLMYISRLRNVLDSLFNNIETNFTATEVLNYSKDISSINMEDVNMVTLPGKAMDGPPWYYFCDWDKAFEILKEDFNLNPELNLDRFNRLYNRVDYLSDFHVQNVSNVDFSENNPSNSDTLIESSESKKTN